jgi:hypothetical protein
MKLLKVIRVHTGDELQQAWLERLITIRRMLLQRVDWHHAVTKSASEGPRILQKPAVDSFYFVAAGSAVYRRRSPRLDQLASVQCLSFLLEEMVECCKSARINVEHFAKNVMASVDWSSFHKSRRIPVIRQN